MKSPARKNFMRLRSGTLKKNQRKNKKLNKGLNKSLQTSEFLRTLKVESQALSELSHYYTNQNRKDLKKVFQILSSLKGKIVTCGVGKSGLIAQKAAATFSSTGTPSIFLHPSEAVHGDLGLLSSDDIVIIFAKSGESFEITNLLASLKKLKCPIIAITAREDSLLARNSDAILLTPLRKEACPFNLAPTSSAILALALADALALTLMKAHHFSAEDFAQIHPGGALGFRLQSQVEDLMIPLAQHKALTLKGITIQDVISHLGAVGMVIFKSPKGKLEGIMTDGDVRRLLDEYQEKIFGIDLQKLINRKPLSLESRTSAHDALKFMEDRPRPLNAVPIVKNAKVVGVLRLHDLLKSR